MAEQMTINGNIKENSNRSSRLMGLEILRIISIFLIICVHLLNYGGFLVNAASGKELLLLRLLYSFFSVSVNVFVLISGYFLVNSKFMLKKILGLWGVVFFYSTGSYFLKLLRTGAAFNFVDFGAAITPFLSLKYWFFSAYLLLYLVFPLLNKIVHNSSLKECMWILIGVFVFSYCSIRFNVSSVIGVLYGYNFLWFICLYLVGAILRLHPPKIKRYIWVLGYFVLILFIWANFNYTKNSFGWKYLFFPAEYTSLLVLLASICLFMSFNGLDIKNKSLRKIIIIISSTTFSVYLFDGSYIKDLLYFNVLNICNYYGRVNSVLYVLVFALIIFILGFIVDIVRQLLVRGIKCIITKIKIKRSESNFIHLEDI